VRFEWDADLTFGELLERLGHVPIPPYLDREEEDIDAPRYQTVYARIEGSVAAPTAGLHFTPELIERLEGEGVEFERVTLHVGAGTFLPVKTDDALAHPMHTEHFEVTLAALDHLWKKRGSIVAVGTTSVRTLESLVALAWRIERAGDPELERPVGQFEPYDIPEEFEFTGARALETLAGWMRTRSVETLRASTRIMITPAGFRFRIVEGLVTNFHQPRSTLLLLIAAFTGGDEWRRIYAHALANDFRFLSYGDSSLLLR
jgi:S-adenosylmethionine:tRNA ribosyltransferase-isomerase